MTTLDVPLILASGSRGRRELLSRAGYEFAVIPSDVPEPDDAVGGDIRKYVGQLAWEKARAVALNQERALVIAADTVGWHGGRVVGKPADREGARRIIAELAGTTHELWSGVALWLRPENWQLLWQERSLVRMAPMTVAEIEAYLDTRLWEGCSGAYALQMPHDPLLTVVEGTASNVIGLPMESLELMLRRLALPAAETSLPGPLCQ